MTVLANFGLQLSVDRIRCFLNRGTIAAAILSLDGLEDDAGSPILSQWQLLVHMSTDQSVDDVVVFFELSPPAHHRAI